MRASHDCLRKCCHCAYVRLNRFALEVSGDDYACIGQNSTLQATWLVHWGVGINIQTTDSRQRLADRETQRQRGRLSVCLYIQMLLIIMLLGVLCKYTGRFRLHIHST